jgi:GT2 family glycosyltransferase
VAHCVALLAVPQRFERGPIERLPDAANGHGEIAEVEVRRLPAPPSLEEMRAHTPRIGPVANGISRPFWSVMITTYNCAQYSRRTLQSVLGQDPGPEEMQIEVVDACSTDDQEGIVNELGQGRVTLHRLPSNEGAAQTFNACIQRARGHWIHILHGDDMVLPGFYEAYQRIIREHSGLSLVCGRVVRIDEDDRWLDVAGPLPPKGTQLIEEFLSKQATRNLVSFPTAVVPREVYEKVGGFCVKFKFVMDMDMWFRAGQAGKVACTSRAYGCYRSHGASATSRLVASGAANIRETYLLTLVNLARLGQPSAVTNRSWRGDLAGYAEGLAWQLTESGNVEGALSQARWAWALKPNYRRLKLVMRTRLAYLRSRATDGHVNGLQPPDESEAAPRPTAAR